MPRDPSRKGGVTDYYSEKNANDVISYSDQPIRTYFMGQNLHEGRPGIKVGAIALGKVQIWSPSWVEVFFSDDAEAARLDVINPTDRQHFIIDGSDTNYRYVTGMSDVNLFAGSIALPFSESVVVGRDLYTELH